MASSSLAKTYRNGITFCMHLTIVVTYFQFDSNIRILYVFLGFLKNTWKYLIQRPIFKPLYNYNAFLKILENTSFWGPSKNTRISYVTTMHLTSPQLHTPMYTTFGLSNGKCNMMLSFNVLVQNLTTWCITFMMFMNVHAIYTWFFLKVISCFCLSMLNPFYYIYIWLSMKGKYFIL